MSTLGQPRKRSRNQLLEALTSERRRRTLALLLDATSPMAERTLATRVAAVEAETSPATVDDERARAVHVDLHHVHLPKLADADLVVRDEGDATVTTTDHPAFQTVELQRVLETEFDGLAEVFDCLTHERRRIAVEALDAEDGEMSTYALARVIAMREAGGLSPDAIEELLLSLRHVHLPKLEDAGLIEVDDETVTDRDCPERSVAESLLAF